MGTRYSVSQLSGSAGTYGLSVKKTDVLLTGSLLLSGSTSRIELGTDWTSGGRQKQGSFVKNEIFLDAAKQAGSPTLVPNVAMVFRSQRLVLSGAAGSSGASSLAIDTFGSGIDRIVMLLAGQKNIREVTLFPMNQNAQDLMMKAPSEVSQNQLDELKLIIKEKK